MLSEESTKGTPFLECALSKEEDYLAVNVNLSR